MKRHAQKGLARWTCAEGRDHTGRAPTQKMAALIAANMSGRQCQGHSGIRGSSMKRRRPVDLTFKAVAEEWLAYYPTLQRVRASSMAAYTAFTVNHLIPGLGHLPISQVDAEVVESFIAGKRQGVGKLSDRTVKWGLHPLGLILKRAVRRGLITHSPMAQVEWVGAKRSETVDPFSAQELRAIFVGADLINVNFGTMLRVWAGCGARAGEITGLQWQDVDLVKGTILIRRTFSHHTVQPTTKTGKERQISFLHPVSVDTADWRPVDGGLLARLSKVAALDPESFVFGGTHPLTSMQVNRLWRRALTKAGVRYRVPEQLRHTCASVLLSRNAPLLYVQQVGGWASAAILLKVYARWVPSQFDVAIHAAPAAAAMRERNVAALR